MSGGDGAWLQFRQGCNRLRDDFLVGAGKMEITLPITAWICVSGAHSRACFNTFTTPACEHAVNTISLFPSTFTIKNRSSISNGSGIQFPSGPLTIC
jgi:hypothetical protein